MSEQVFADGIGPIVVVGGTVRLDFITLIADEHEASRPKPVVQHRLFMPIDAFQTAAQRFAEAAAAIAKLKEPPAAEAPPQSVPPQTVAPSAAAERSAPDIEPQSEPRKPPFP